MLNIIQFKKKKNLRKKKENKISTWDLIEKLNQQTASFSHEIAVVHNANFLTNVPHL